MYCNKCGKELMAGALFCSFCGAKQNAVCSNCGTELANGAMFCHKCGTKVGGQAETTCSTKGTSKASYDIRGLHSRFVNQFCANKNILVFSDYGATYLYDKNGNFFTIKESSSYLGITDDAVYSCVIDYGSDDGKNVVYIKKYDYELKLISEKEIDRYAPEGPVSVLYTMNGAAIYKISYANKRDADGNGIYSNLVFAKNNLETGEKKEYKFDTFNSNEGIFTDFEDRFILVDEDKIYLRGMFVTYDEDGDSNLDAAVVTFDFASGRAEILWKDPGRGYGKPLFFDFEKKIMWTYTTEREDEAVGRKYGRGRAIVARQIAPNSAILNDYKIWENVDLPSGFNYFDGETAYVSDNYYTFFGLMQNGIKSEDWNKTGHGRAETTIVWDGKIISDIYADYKYFVYPAEFSKPNDERIIKLG